METLRAWLPIRLILAHIILLSGCASFDHANLGSAGAVAGAIALRDPIVERCKQAALKSCSESADALVSYAQGDKQKGRMQLETFAAQNTPAALHEFAGALLLFRDTVPSSSFSAALWEAAGVLNAGGSAPTGVPFHSAPVRSDEARLLSASATSGSDAPHDVEQVGGRRELAAGATLVDTLDGGLASPGHSNLLVKCAAAGIVGNCVTATKGPFVVTDLQMVGGCTHKVLVLIAKTAGDLGSPRWAVTNEPSGIAIHGTRLLVRADESLLVGLEGRRKDSRCAVAWNGVRLSSSAPHEEPSASIGDSSKLIAAIAPSEPSEPAPEAESDDHLLPVKLPSKKSAHRVVAPVAMVADQQQRSTPPDDLTQADNYVRTGELDRAIEIYERIVRDKDLATLPRALRALGIAYYRKGNGTAAADAFRRFLPYASDEERPQIQDLVGLAEKQVP